MHFIVGESIGSFRLLVALRAINELINQNFFDFLCSLPYAIYGLPIWRIFPSCLTWYFAYLPLSHSSFTFISSILVCVMSLCEARNSTTSRFSFFMGTISNRHQNGAPVKQLEKRGRERVGNNKRELCCE